MKGAVSPLSTHAAKANGEVRHRISAREEALVPRLRAQDLRAFEELYQLVRPQLTRFVMNMTRCPELAEDVINETMLAAWRALPNFKGESKISTWIFAIAYRTATRAVKRFDGAVSTEQNDEIADEAGGPDHGINTTKIAKLLSKAISELSADHRLVIELTYYQDLGYRDIAQIMNCPIDTVKTRMFHARRHLKARLNGDKSDWL